MSRDLSAVVFAGGMEPQLQDASGLDAVDLSIAADSGYDHATALGVACDVLVGDLDSISPAGLRRAEAGSTEILRHPADKDRTDLELALELALERGATRIIVVGGHGGRLDHFLANVGVLTADHLAGIDVEARMGGDKLFVVREGLLLAAPVGTTVSLVAAGGVASGVRTHGLRWDLTGEALHPGSGRGISNEVVSHPAEIAVADGVLLVVQPGPPAA